MTEETRLGHEFYAYRDTAGTWGSETWDLMDEIKADTPANKKTAVDVTRRSHGSKRFRSGLPENDVELMVPYRKDDTTGALHADLQALLTAYDSGAILIIALADGPIATTGTQYSKAEYEIFEKSQPKEIDGESVITFKLKEADTANELTVTTVP